MIYCRGGVIGGVMGKPTFTIGDLGGAFKRKKATRSPGQQQNPLLQEVVRLKGELLYYQGVAAGQAMASGVAPSKAEDKVHDVRISIEGMRGMGQQQASQQPMMYPQGQQPQVYEIPTEPQPVDRGWVGELDKTGAKK